MSDDYLWDRTGSPDPEVRKLEEELAVFRSRRGAPEWPDAATTGGSAAESTDGGTTRAPRSTPGGRVLRLPRTRRGIGWISAAAAAVVLWAAVATRSPVSTAPGWVVETRAPSGGPRVPDHLAAGEWLDTRAALRLEAEDFGQVEVEPGTRLRVVASRSGARRLDLRRGVIHAAIWAPPGHFEVEMPSAVAVDLGCAYTLSVDSRGAGTIEVEAGWVGFAHRGRESFIPAGALCETRPRVGPGTPFAVDVAPSVREALETIDFSRDRKARAAALDLVLGAARPEDAFTLWHLLRRGDADERGRVQDRLAALSPPPEGVTRGGVLAGDRRMLDAWWNSFGLGSVELWRTWESRWR